MFARNRLLSFNNGAVFGADDRETIERFSTTAVDNYKGVQPIRGRLFCELLKATFDTFLETI